MAKVIKRGTPPEEHRYRHVCPSCRSIVEYTRKDAQHIYHVTAEWVNCPVCDYYIAWRHVVISDREQRGLGIDMSEGGTR